MSKFKIIVLSYILCILLIISCSDEINQNNDYQKDIVELEKFEEYESDTNFVFVKGGSFEMGTYFGGYSIEYPRHLVNISDFIIGKYEISQSEWAVYMPSKKYYFGHGNDHPVYHVSWYEAIVYCNLRSIGEGFDPCYSLSGSTHPADWGVIPTGLLCSEWDKIECDWTAGGYRMPTEAEWEYAAKGGINWQDNFKFAGSDIVESVSWFLENSGNIAKSVGKKQPNQLGIYDMSGNIAEWCWDWYDQDYYISKKTNESNDPKGPHKGKYRIIRGGNYTELIWSCRVAARNYFFPGYKYQPVGLRLARSYAE